MVFLSYTSEFAASKIPFGGEIMGEKLLILAGFILICLGIAFLLLIWGIKRKRINIYNAIDIRHRLLSFLGATLIFSIFPIAVSCILMILFYIFLRKIAFEADARYQQYLYEQYEGKDRPYPLVENWKDVLLCRVGISLTSKSSKEFRYSLSQFWDNWALLPILGLLQLVVLSRASVAIYVIEYGMASLALLVLLAKITYHIAVSNPNSKFYLAPYAAYIPVAFYCILFLILDLIILKYTLP